MNNTEFTSQPICTASRKYQSEKIAQLKKMELVPEEFEKQAKDVYAKECLCVGLSNSASLVYNVPFVKKLTSVTICPGPNIVNFSKIVTLKQMIDHIYGRLNILGNPERPHVFINELKIYINYYREIIAERINQAKEASYLAKFGKNLLEGIAYYGSLLDEVNTRDFELHLREAEEKITELLEHFVERQAIS